MENASTNATIRGRQLPIPTNIQLEVTAMAVRRYVRECAPQPRSQKLMASLTSIPQNAQDAANATMFAPRRAITPARVTIDQAKCTKCGDCYNVCAYNSVTKTGSSTTVDPVIDLAKCTRCGKCVPACPQIAIDKTSPSVITDPTIDQAICTSCGLCYKVCPSSAIDRTVNTAEIEDKNCIKCGKCEEACPEGAIATN